MALRIYVCSDCKHTQEYLQQPAVDGGYTNVPTNCPVCNSESYLKDFLSNVQNISVDVPGGYEYTYGKKAAASGNLGSKAEAEAIYNASIGKNPY